MTAGCPSVSEPLIVNGRAREPAFTLARSTNEAAGIELSVCARDSRREPLADARGSRQRGGLGLVRFDGR